MGYDKDAVQVLLYSWVRFVRDGVEISMSKRAGEFITLDELLAEVGVDAARWFFASRGHTSSIDFDIELAKKQSNENPVYYVQYAHARDRLDPAQAPRTPGSSRRTPSPAPWSTVRKRRSPGPSCASPKSSRTRWPPRRPTASRPTRPSSPPRSMRSIAMRGSSTRTAPERSAARLALARATQVTLANTLALLGISAPASM